ncbi:MAG: PilZ domain-containing protein [Spirochaetes bacterium]|nr:PilZ domain-containing protein [Spirochaetota bacterium]
MTNERRTHTRVPFTIDATVKHGKRRISGLLLNISLLGMYIEIADKIPLNEVVDVEIVLDCGGSRMSLLLPGEVIRSESGGTAVKLREMNLDSYIALRNLMMDNASDPKTIMDEFSRFISDRGNQSL